MEASDAGVPPCRCPPPRVPFSADLINELLTGPVRETIAANHGKTGAAKRYVQKGAPGPFFRRGDPIII